MINELREVRKLIAKGWCKWYMATDSWGQEVEVKSDSATNFCLLGACHKIKVREDTKEKIYDKLESLEYLRSLSFFNDCSTKEGVLNLLDSLIQNN